MSSDFPVFIGGAGRSGTTLVVDMFGVHSHLSPIYETDFVVQLIPELFGGHGRSRDQIEARVRSFMDQWTAPLPLRPHNKREYERYLHGPHHVLFTRETALAELDRLFEALRAGQGVPAFRTFLDALFGAHCEAAGKPRWINKTPAYVHLLPALDQLYPGFRFVHCVRDGRDVACSVVTRPWGPNTHLGGGDWWARKVMDGLRWGLANPDRYLEVRYEDLLQAPAPTLSRVLGFLGVADESAEMVATYEAGAARLDPGRCGAWRERFAPEETAAFEQRHRAMLQHLGYPLGEDLRQAG